MPRNEQLVDFRLENAPAERMDPYADATWGAFESVIILTGGQYDARVTPYHWLYMSREVVKRLHRATGEYLAKEALGA